MISYVIPVFNEEESLELLYAELIDAIHKIKNAYEIIFIDDGSNDSSLKIIQKLLKRDIHIRIFSFRKNQGKAEALMLGFQKAKGEKVVTLDADLQDKPSEIHKLLDVLNNDWDVVCGWRKERRDKRKMVIASKFFNMLARVFWGLKLHDYNCGLKAFTAETAKSLRLYGGFYRFIPLLAYQEGFSVTEVVVEHQARIYGTSKFGFSKMKDLPDIFTILFLHKYSKRPMHFFGNLGGAIFVLGLVILLYLTQQHFAGYSISRRPLLIFGVLFILVGLQISLTGFLADLIISTSAREVIHYPLRYSSEKT